MRSQDIDTVNGDCEWVVPQVKQISNYAKQLRAQGHSLTLSTLPVDKTTKGTKMAEAAAAATHALGIAFLRATMRENKGATDQN